MLHRPVSDWHIDLRASRRWRRSPGCNQWRIPSPSATPQRWGALYAPLFLDQAHYIKLKKNTFQNYFFWMFESRKFSLKHYDLKIEHFDNSKWQCILYFIIEHAIYIGIKVRKYQKIQRRKLYYFFC